MRGDLAAGVLGVIAGAAVVRGALGLGVGTPADARPGFVPLLGGLALAALSGLLVVQACVGRSAGTMRVGDVRRPALLVAGIGVYAALLDPLGYLPATALVTGVSLRALGAASWPAIAAGSLALATGTYLLFARVLGADLPAGLLERLGP